MVKDTWVGVLKKGISDEGKAMLGANLNALLYTRGQAGVLRTYPLVLGTVTKWISSWTPSNQFVQCDSYCSPGRSNGYPYCSGTIHLFSNCLCVRGVGPVNAAQTSTWQYSLCTYL